MKIIIFEGLDGSGKTTFIQNIKEELQAQNQEVITLQGLGSSSIGPQIRKMFLTHENLDNQTRLLLSFSNMIQTQEEQITPHIFSNKIILIDRWLGSNFAYRIYPSQNKRDYQIFYNLFNRFIKPDTTVYLKTNPEIGINRKRTQSNHKLDVIESSPISYFKKVEQGYDEFLKLPNLGTKIILDTTDFTNISQHQKNIIKKIGNIKQWQL